MLTLQLLCRRSQMLQASPRRSLTQQAILGAALLPCRLATSQTLEATSSLHQWTTCWATACLRPCAALPPRLASGMARWVLGLSLEIVLQPDIKALPSCAELAAEQQLKYIRIHHGLLLLLCMACVARPAHRASVHAVESVCW